MCKVLFNFIKHAWIILVSFYTMYIVHFLQVYLDAMWKWPATCGLQATFPIALFWST